MQITETSLGFKKYLVESVGNNSLMEVAKHELGRVIVQDVEETNWESSYKVISLSPKSVCKNQPNLPDMLH